MLFCYLQPGTGRVPGFYILLPLILFISIPIQARQKINALPQIIPRSPDARIAENRIMVPASESTGVADLNIPLVDIKVGSFALPITIGYHKNGLRVDDVPSCVGDGWSLQYGGIITFRQNGLHDFKTGGLFDGGITSASMTKLKSYLRGQLTTEQQWAYFEQAMDGTADTEFDQYQYSFMGKSGAYYYDTLMNAVTVPATNMKIFRQANEIRILDTENNNYYFGAIEQAAGIDSSSDGYRAPFKDISTYYLSRIVTHENRTISFRYKKYTYTVNRNKPVIRFTPETGTPSCNAENGVSTYMHTEQVSCLLPDSIIFDLGLIRFSSSTEPREDIKTIQETATVPYITGFSFFAADKKIREFSFVQDYFDANKRLKLAEIRELRGVEVDKSWKLQYYHEKGAFPAFFANDQDHWGYYNAAGNTGLIPDVDYSSLIPGWNNPTAAYGNRSADSAAVYGMLQSVIYPTGGSTAFEYEPNQVRVSDYSQLTTLSPFLKVPGGTPVPYKVGGVRIKTVITNDSTGAGSRYRKYVYTDSLNKVAFPNIPYYINTLGFNMNIAGVCTSCGTRSYVFDESVKPFVGSAVIYSHVTVYDSSAAGIKGKTESTFLLPVDETASHTAPYVFPVNTFWYAGKLLRENLYASVNDTFRLIQERQYTYNDQNKQRITTGFRADYAQYCELNTADNTAFNVSLSTLFTDRFTLSQSKQTEYLPVQSMINQVDYTGSAAHVLPVIVTRVNSKSEQVSERIIYSFDYDTTTVISNEWPAVAIRNLRRMNVLVPIETIQYRTIDGVDYVTGATMVKYESNRALKDTIWQLRLNAPIPMSMYTVSSIVAGKLVKDSRYERVMYFDEYDSNNNVLQIISEYGSSISYKYDYQQMYRIVEVINGPADGIAYTSFETSYKGGWGYAGIPVTDPTSPVGDKCYNLSTGSLVFTGLRDYTQMLSYWTKNTVPYTFSGELPWTPVRGKTVNGWTFFLHWIDPLAQNIVFPNNGYVDDVRLSPMGGQMKTYTYEPHVGVKTVGDDRGNVTSYSYDEIGRLKMVKDGEGKILKLFDYQYEKPITQ